MKNFYLLRAFLAALLFGTASLSQAVTVLDVSGFLSAGPTFLSVPFNVTAADNYTSTLNLTDFGVSTNPASSYFGLFDVANNNTMVGFATITGQSTASFTTFLTAGLYSAQMFGFANNVPLDYHITVTSAVPEAETYAMMLVGLGLISLISRRRRKTASASLDFA